MNNDPVFLHKLERCLKVSVFSLLGVSQLVYFPHGTHVSVRKGAVESDAVAVTPLHKLQSPLSRRHARYRSDGEMP